MARVRATQYRVVIQFADQFGHRLESEKGLWNQMMLPVVEADCPKCPEPEPEPVECEEPEPAKVECAERGWHTASRQALYGFRYCPRCGVALTTEA